MMIKSTVGHCTDLIKDIILAIQIAMSQGGLIQLMSQKKPFIKGVSTTKLRLGELSLGTFFTDIFSFFGLYYHSIGDQQYSICLKGTAHSFWQKHFSSLATIDYPVSDLPCVPHNERKHSTRSK